MAKKQKYIIEFDAETGQAVQGIEGVNDALDKTGKKTEEVSDSFGGAADKIDELSGGMVSGFGKGLKGVRGLIGGMNSLKGAVISTGIGALIVALAVLVNWFRTSEKGARFFRKAGLTLEILFNQLTTAVNALVENDLTSFFSDPMESIKGMGEAFMTYIIDNTRKMIDGLGLLGKAVSQLFDGDFSEAFETAKQGAASLADGFLHLNPATALLVAQGEILISIVEGVGDAFEEASIKADKLEGIEHDLMMATRALVVENARLQTEIDKEQKKIDDTTLSYEERTKALDRQSEKSEQLAKNIARLAGLEEDALNQQIAITSNYQERIDLEQQLADKTAERIEKVAQVAIIELDNAQKRREIDIEEFERVKAIAQTLQDLRLQTVEEERKKIEEDFAIQQERALQELEVLRASEEQKKELKESYAALTNAALKEFDNERKKEKEAADDADIKSDLALQDAKRKIAGDAIGALSALVNAFEANNEKSARKQFAVSKALGIAEAVINTARGITAALNDIAFLPGQRIANAVITGAFGAAQVVKIASTQFGGGSGGGGGVSVPSSSTPSAPQQTAPQVDFGFLQQGNNQNTIQAYVLAQNVTNSTQANQLVKDQAAL